MSKKKIPAKPKKARGKGRPTAYKKKYCQEIIEYFKREPIRNKIIEHFSPKTGDVVSLVQEAAAAPPTLYGFAASIGVHRDTLDEWKRKHPDFSDSMQRAKSYQADFIVHNAMTGLSPSSFAKFMMANNFGWKEKSEIEQSTTTVQRLIVDMGDDPINSNE